MCPAGLVIQALSRWTTDYQRSCWPTKGIQPESCHGPGTFDGGTNPQPVSAGDGLAKRQLDFVNTQLPHWVTEVSTLTVSPIPETDRHSWGWTSNHHPVSTQHGNSFGRMNLCRFGCFILAFFKCCFTFFLYLS